MISVIIPAHNEENVIFKTLKTLTDEAFEENVEIIVVCNGCTDKTAEIALSFGKPIICIETPISSKTNALNLGESMATGFPRFYLDADVVLASSAIKEVAKVLRDGMFLAAAPKMEMVLANSSWAVRAYYEIWQQLPYVQEGMIGTGVYALNEEGRRRFEHFPPIISDDGFVRALFRNNERTVVNSCRSLVRAPANLTGLMKIKTRSRLGYYQLIQNFPQFNKKEANHTAVAMMVVLKKPRLWIKSFFYLYINLIARTRAQLLIRKGEVTHWERDDSSRLI